MTPFISAQIAACRVRKTCRLLLFYFSFVILPCPIRSFSLHKFQQPLFIRKTLTPSPRSFRRTRRPVPVLRHSSCKTPVCCGRRSFHRNGCHDLRARHIFCKTVVCCAPATLFIAAPVRPVCCAPAARFIDALLRPGCCSPPAGLVRAKRSGF